ncbi:carboxyltransferase domain-containing protein, partial [Loigolactobacillus coryniformis]|uniref:carboxyltransferase domain-containing protein n=1 Tax=Loigolactobacillus coryniformis TaxID=1610 RepID=UPI00201A658F
DYLVLGLGDVYLGAPVATPLDPRHRLVTTKYNPARTWTAENSVGIGGAYLCIYGMEGPGGYQFVGRTTQVWSRHRDTAPFEPGS